MGKNAKHMFGEKMELKNAPQALKHIWEKKFFDGKERSFSEIRSKISKLGCNPYDETLHMALKNAKYLTRRGKKRNYRYIQKYAPKGAVLSEEIFPESLIKAMGDEFKTEISDLNLNYGRSGTCTAFLLRKILEKLIFLAFAKNGLEDQLKGNNSSFVGLKTMLNLATKNKVRGKAFLMAKTAKEIEGTKFLGDTSAHNPLINVGMKTIIPQMPFIITAYEELSKKL
jgi:hypothetical protein